MATLYEVFQRNNYNRKKLLNSDPKRKRNWSKVRFIHDNRLAFATGSRSLNPIFLTGWSRHRPIDRLPRFRIAP